MAGKFVQGLRCPECGSALLTNGLDVWCSFVGGAGVKACDYGIRHTVQVRVDPLATSQVEADVPHEVADIGGES